MQWNENDAAPTEIFKPGGVYPATVLDAEERVSQKGNNYIWLTLQVYGENERSAKQRVAIMPAFYPKLKAFCVSAGLMESLKTFTLEAVDCVGRNVRVKMTPWKNENGYLEIDTFISSDADDDGVRDAIAKFAGNTNIPAAADDDIPF